MGIYDRQYYRDEPSPSLQASWNNRSPISMIIIICVACFVLNLFFPPPERLSGLLALHSSDLYHPQYWWRFLTYGFAHSDRSVSHLLFNMIALWFLGRSVEDRYGWAEFWRIYLISIILCGLVFVGVRVLTGSGGSVVGASGAVLTVTMLFIFNYPTSTLYFFGVFPIPAWALGLFIVIMNFVVRPTEAVAYDAHLAGIAFAAIYFYGNLNFRFLGDIPGVFRRWKRKTFGTKLKTFDGERYESPSVATEDDESKADQLLAKIHQHGQDSLTSKEKKFLEAYSKKMREKQKSY